jgi:hypothetical protein
MQMNAGMVCTHACELVKVTVLLRVRVGVGSDFMEI